MSNIFTSLLQEQEQQKQIARPQPAVSSEPLPAIKPDAPAASTDQRDQPRAEPRANPREASRDLEREVRREPSRDLPRDLPTRDAIQLFTFQLRDEPNVKMQAEIPHHWQAELNRIALELNVKKLELYRYIVGQFLGKTAAGRGAAHAAAEKPL